MPHYFIADTKEKQKMLRAPLKAKSDPSLLWLNSSEAHSFRKAS